MKKHPVLEFGLMCVCGWGITQRMDYVGWSAESVFLGCILVFGLAGWGAGLRS